jgi:arylsulfatase A-like enzyme
MRVQLLKYFGRVLLLLLVTLARTMECGAAIRKPNVVVLIADDLGVGDLGFSGAKIIFRNGYVSPMCAPTRAAFLTGSYPAKIGFEDNRPGDTRHFGMDLSLKTMADVLRDAGYATGLIGKWHVGRGLNHEYSPWNRGFDEFVGYYGAFGTYVDPKLTRPPGDEKIAAGYSTDIFANLACDFLQRHKDKPFFLNVAFNAAHLEQVAKPEDLEEFQHIENPKRRKAAAIISNLDANIGRIAARLKELHLDRNTLLFFFSDNGGEPPILGTMNGSLRGMKFDVYEGGIRVPFFTRWPEGLPGGKSSDALISVVDLLPTIAAATHAKAPKEIDGTNLLPYLRGDTKIEPHNILFWRTTEHAALQKMRKQPKGAPIYVPHLAAVREGQWKLVVHDDAGKNPHFELYALNDDPSEKNDVSKANPKIVARLSKKLDGWRGTLKPQMIPPTKP